MNDQIATKLKEVLHLLESGNPEEGLKILDTLYMSDLESKELLYTGRCCNYWNDNFKRLEKIEDAYERCVGLFPAWKNFQVFITREKLSVYEPAFYASQTGFFRTALKQFSEMLDEKDTVQKAEMLKSAGICYKWLGDYENARLCLKQANLLHKNQAGILAELADCYCLCGDERIGKVLFREAFFVNPEEIDLEFLVSDLIKRLINKVQEKGYEGKPLLYWIPVYGVLQGILNIKRELTPQEVIRLKNSIFDLENEIKVPSCDEEILIPQLLNCYFWLIDHYVLTHENAVKINDVLLKIKILDISIYQAYRK